MATRGSALIACVPVSVAAECFALLALVGVVACYHGYDVEDEQVPPGYAGGACQSGACVDGSLDGREPYAYFCMPLGL